MSKKAIISALVLSVVIFSAQPSAQASINPEIFGNIQTESNVNLVKFDIGYQLEKSAAFSPNAEPVQLAWSITGVVKKIGGGVTGVARATGRVVNRVHRVIVPSEIRDATSYAYKKAKSGVRYAAEHPYGKRCKPGQNLLPSCAVKSTGRRTVRDHRN